jgi:sulfonate transport system ATP-binding protein
MTLAASTAARDLLAPFASSASSAAPVVARDLGKAYGDKIVLRGLDFVVPEGQFVAIVGRSGCGKSTLLRLIAGLETPDAGRLSVGTTNASPREAARVMFQEPRLLPWANVLDNVAVGLGAAEGAEGRRLATEALTRVGLADRAGEWPAVLSGGQKQRVALARALVSRPRLLALDEPLGALDALTRIEMQRLLEAVWLRERFTAILVTHDVVEAVALADRIVLIEQGALALDVKVDLPRPRRHGSPETAKLSETILTRLLDEERAEEAGTSVARRRRPLAIDSCNPCWSKMIEHNVPFYEPEDP